LIPVALLMAANVVNHCDSCKIALNV